jgi:hypothetical protein
MQAAAETTSGLLEVPAKPARVAEEHRRSIRRRGPGALAASVGGTLAILTSVTVIVGAFLRPGVGAPPITLLALILGLAGGVVSIAAAHQIEGLFVGDVLVALAILCLMYTQLALLFLPALLLIGLGTLRARCRDELEPEFLAEGPSRPPVISADSMLKAG